MNVYFYHKSDKVNGTFIEIYVKTFCCKKLEDGRKRVNMNLYIKTKKLWKDNDVSFQYPCKLKNVA